MKRENILQDEAMKKRTQGKYGVRVNLFNALRTPNLPVEIHNVEDNVWGGEGDGEGKEKIE